MKRLLALSRLSALLILFMLAYSCSKDDDPENDGLVEGSFEINISGDENLTLTGEAFFEQLIINGGTPESSGTTLSLIFTEESENALALSMVKAATNGFGEGTYTFIEDPEDDQLFFSVTFYSESSESTYFITSGTVDFDRVNERTIEGSLDIEMQNFMEGNINVSGTFKARDLYLFK